MPTKYEAVTADTSCFILLDKIGEIEILQKLFTNIIITPTIAAEFGKPLPDWIKIVTVKNQDYKNSLEIEVDPGEASALALSKQYNTSLIIPDDLKP
jgi:predicted nucleic acid-binding protein